LPLLLKYGSFLPRSKSKSGRCGKPLGKNRKKGQKLAVNCRFSRQMIAAYGAKPCRAGLKAAILLLGSFVKKFLYVENLP